MAYTNGARYPMKARPATPSRYTRRVPAPATVGARVTVILHDGRELDGLAYHEAHGVFHGAADFGQWAGNYAAMYPRRYAVDSVQLDEITIKLTDIHAVK